MTYYHNGDSRANLPDESRAIRLPATDLGENALVAPAWIAYIDRQERIRFVNPAYCRQLGRARGDVLGRTAREVFGADLYAVIRDGLRGALAGESRCQQVQRHRGDDQGTIVREAHFEPAEDQSGKVAGCYLIELDVTEQKQWESQLLEARQAAEAASEAKSRFVAQMNHEIRTPMAAMLGYVEILARREEDPEKLEVLNTIRRNGDLLTEIVDDMLDLAKIEAGKLQIGREAFDLDELLADIHATMRGRAEEKQIELTVQHQGPVPEVVETDPTRLRQILLNLVGNAIKFTEEGEVRLTICAVDGRKDRLRFEVADTGIGMTPEQINRVFVPFAQADPSITRSFGGTGLGLSISRRLAELLDGGIEVASEPGKGSVFSLEIGIGAALVAEADLATRPRVLTAAAPRSTKGRPLQGKRILVADDRRDARLMIEHFLIEAGAQVDFAADGVEAVEAVRESLQSNRTLNAVLLDMQMPRLDGYEAAEQMRSVGFEAPIIALTADAMEGERRRSLAAGCDDHIRKPIDADELIQVLAAYGRYKTNYSPK